jgi:hypothetical protein
MPIIKFFVVPLSTTLSWLSSAMSRETLTDRRPPATLPHHHGETVMHRRLERVICGMGLAVGLTLTACEACDNTTKTGATEGDEIVCSE